MKWDFKMVIFIVYWS